MSEQVCVIIGAGHAAAQLVASLVQEKWPGRILLVGDEPWLPYNRPPLSKTFLAGVSDADDLLIRPASSYEKFNVECITGKRAIGIDTDKHTVTLSDGSMLEWTHLALCTGGSPRKLSLPGSDLEGVHYLRTINDVENIRAQLGSSKKIVVVGGGYIGLETAAMLRKLDFEVTILEAADRLLGRVTSPAMSEFFRELHASKGVNIVTRALVSTIHGDGRVTHVETADGAIYPCDLVIAGIGIIPETGLAEEAGLAVKDGVLVDELCRTSNPEILAAGDCTRFTSQFYAKKSMRLESVQNAVDQAKTAAATLCGKVKPYTDLPWFWSDQYDLKLQIAGLSEGYTDLVFRGEPEPGGEQPCSFAAFYLNDEQLLAVEAVNSPRDFMLGKRLVQNRVKVQKLRLMDPEVSLKSLLEG